MDEQVSSYALCDAIVAAHDKAVQDFAQGWIDHNSILAAHLTTKGVSLTLLTEAVRYAARRVATEKDAANTDKNVQAFVGAVKTVLARLEALERDNADLRTRLRRFEEPDL